ncbi:YadA-like family protein [Moraxella catarrhalis]|uniref:YadA-like family protein n=2 Tax=Moraxella catarrhalis TaxID=480 RepID=UPI001D0D1D12|nr:YadA-like family protein [Moraxella catarrhalis]
MKLLPLKIAVTSAMIVGLLGAASTANAQAQAGSPIERIQNDIQDRIGKFMVENDYDQLKEGKLDQEKFQKYMNFSQIGNTLTMGELNRNIGTNAQKLENAAKLYGELSGTVGTNIKSIKDNKESIAKNKANIKTLAQAQLESATFLGEQIQENKDDISAVTGKAFKNQIDIQKNNDSIEDLYEANNDNVERLVEHDRAIEILTEAGNHHDTLIRKNKANIKTLAQAQLESVTFLGEQIQENKDDISTLTRKSFQNQVDIVRNNASIEDLYAYGEEVAKSIGEIHTHNEEQNKTLENLITNSTNNTDNIDKNKAKIQDLAKAQLESVTFLGEQIQENKTDIAANKADADAKFKGVQTDIANNKTTLAEHAKKINDNQQAIEAKLGGKADLQKLSELKTSVDKNQAGIQLHDQKINNLGILHTMVARAVGANKTAIDQNKADIAKNNESIEDLYEANAENVERLTQVDNNVFVNRLNIQELKRKQENDIKDVVGMQNAIAEQADKNKNHIQDLAKAQLAGVEVMDELNKNVEKNKADADANFETLTKNQNALIEKDKAQDTLIAKNKADADANFETLTKNQNALIEKDKAQDKLITANKADADAKFTGVQTDIANNKTTLAQHAKKINDNQQAIEAKLGGKADAQALNSLNDKVNGFDGRISALDTKVNAFDGRITALDSKVENGMAAQAALSGLFQPYSVGKFNATAALGGYGSKSAVAIGAGYRVNPNLAIKAGAAINTSGDKKGSYNIGVNYEF